MSVQPVPTIRAAHLSPYIEFLQDKGVPIERPLERCNLPTFLGDNPNAHIPLVPALQFLSLVQQAQGLREISFLVSGRIGLDLLTPSTLRLLLSAPTLNAMLSTFFRYVAAESSVVDGWTIDEGGETATICMNQSISADEEELRIMQIHFTLLLLALIKVFAGSGWRPQTMGFKCRLPLSPLVGHYFPTTRFHFGQTHSWVNIPAELLGSERIRAMHTSLHKPVLQTSSVEPDLLPCDIAGSLKRVLKSYLSDGYPSIELAAEISGTSVRSLQRGLAQCGMTYSKLVDRARFEAAMELLRDPNIKIIEIAYAVGYEDPSHFSRAFRRMAGTSPREYRINVAA